jgi:hypothetical protein
MAGNDSYVQVQADSVGKKVKTVEFTDSNGALVEAQAVVLLDRNGTVTPVATQASIDTLNASVNALFRAFCTVHDLNPEDFRQGD